jgi:hypothetical protein
MSISVGLVVLGYVLTCVWSFWLYRFEVAAECRDSSSTLQPRFWLFTAGLLAIMAVGRSVHLGDLVGGYGRHQAHVQGWYDARRSIQAVAVLAVFAVGCAWMVAWLLTFWRAPDRRRYTPTAIAVGWLVCFGAIRVISLHQVDTLMTWSTIHGALFGIELEIAALIAVIVTMAWARRQALSTAVVRVITPR